MGKENGVKALSKAFLTTIWMLKIFAKYISLIIEVTTRGLSFFSKNDQLTTKSAYIIISKGGVANLISSINWESL